MLKALRVFASGWWPIAVMALLMGVVLYQRWESTHPQHRELLKAGDRLPSVTLRTISGAPAQVDWKFGYGSTVVYVFRPDCVWCAKNREAFSALLKGAKGYRFIGLSLNSSGLGEYLTANQPFIDTVYVVPDKAKPSLKFSGTPETVVLSPAGEVLKVWRGAYVRETKEQLEKTFNVRLPVIDLHSNAVPE